MNLQLGLDDGKLEVMVTGVDKLRSKNGRYPNKMTLEASLVPGDLSDKQKSQEFQGEGKTVNMDPEVRFDFVTNTSLWDNGGGFLTIDLWGKWKMIQRTQLIGSVVIRLRPGKDFVAETRYRLHTTWPDEDLAERRELEFRTDPMAKDFVSRQWQVSSPRINGNDLSVDSNSVMLG